MALLGGIFLGFGAALVQPLHQHGHRISGTLQLAVSSWISAVSFFVGGILAAQIIFKVIAWE